MKASHILYLFDMDGTLFGQEQWKGIISNHIDNFKSRVYINPSRFDIRWSILTGRPKIDKPIIKLCCSLKGLFPEKIITINSWKYPFQNDEQKYSWKYYTIMRGLLIARKDLPQYNRTIRNIVYVDNDISTNRYINSKNDPNILAVTVPDFVNGTYSFLL